MLNWSGLESATGELLNLLAVATGYRVYAEDLRMLTQLADVAHQVQANLNLTVLTNSGHFTALYR